MINPLSLLTSAVSWVGSWLPEAIRPASSTPSGIADTSSTLESLMKDEKPAKPKGWFSWLFSKFKRSEPETAVTPLPRRRQPALPVRREEENGVGLEQYQQRQLTQNFGARLSEEVQIAIFALQEREDLNDAQVNIRAQFNSAIKDGLDNDAQAQFYFIQIAKAETPSITPSVADETKEQIEIEEEQDIEVTKEEEPKVTIGVDQFINGAVLRSLRMHLQDNGFNKRKTIDAITTSICDFIKARAVEGNLTNPKFSSEGKEIHFTFVGQKPDSISVENDNIVVSDLENGYCFTFVGE